MRISDWSSDVCSSDLGARIGFRQSAGGAERLVQGRAVDDVKAEQLLLGLGERPVEHQRLVAALAQRGRRGGRQQAGDGAEPAPVRQFLLNDGELRHDRVVLVLGPGADNVFFRSEEHTSELQSLMRISYAVFCLKKKNKHTQQRQYEETNVRHDLI